MRPEDFASKISGSLVQIADGHCAFVPNRLPPAFSIDSDINLENDRSLLALGELRAIIPYMPNPELITNPFLRREAVLSSKIEGTRTELDQLYLFEVDSPETDSTDSASTRDAREVHNYVVALEYGLQRLATLPICNRLLREMHEKLLDGVAPERGQYKNPGQFRREQAYIGNQYDMASARYVPPPPELLENLMNDLEHYFHASPKYHPALVRIAIAHYQFEAIHPFCDGNGRIGRLMISLLLAAWKILPQPLLYLSAYFERKADEYRRLLWRVSSQNDWAAWTKFFLRGVCAEAEDATNRAKAVLNLREEYRQQLQRRKGSTNAFSLVDLLFKSPFITVTEAANALEISYPSAKENVEKLVDAGVLVEYGERRWNRIYCAEPILSLLR
jgi:Fic family protein